MKKIFFDGKKLKNRSRDRGERTTFFVTFHPWTPEGAPGAPKSAPGSPKGATGRHFHRFFTVIGWPRGIFLNVFCEFECVVSWGVISAACKMFTVKVELLEVDGWWQALRAVRCTGCRLLQQQWCTAAAVILTRACKTAMAMVTKRCTCAAFEPLVEH